MRHVRAARSTLHVPEIMRKVHHEDKINGKSIGDPAGLEANQERDAAEKLDRRDEITEPRRRRDATRDKIKEPFECGLIEGKPGINIRNRQIAKNKKDRR